MRDFAMPVGFLSIQAQDFIEDMKWMIFSHLVEIIPEHSSSGLH